ncbi:hypothetical protein GCK32_016789 [Trichostrongylus colubriformis]|uniref:Uncharacterized protein n=1 Tax=Trichostrongylus colubriformis TaxID=6319 RepID=A0AAN8GAQ9_TRICO
MRCVLLFLVLSTFVICGDVHIQKVVEDLTGWSEADVKIMDKTAEEFTDQKTKQLDKAKYDERLKNQHKAIWEKTLKFRETLKKVSNENKAALGFIDSVLSYAVMTRYGHMKEDEASKRVVQDFGKLADNVKVYLVGTFPALKQFMPVAKKI